MRARNGGSLPVCAIRLSVASAAAFSNVCGPDAVHAASVSATPIATPQSRRWKPCGQSRLHLHSRLKKSVSAGVIFSSEAFCRISMQRAWPSSGAGPRAAAAGAATDAGAAATVTGGLAGAGAGVAATGTGIGAGNRSVRGRRYRHPVAVASAG